MVALHISICLSITEFQTSTSSTMIPSECYPVYRSLLSENGLGGFSPYPLLLESSCLFMALSFAYTTQCPYIENIKDLGILTHICLDKQYESVALLRLQWMLSQPLLYTLRGYSEKMDQMVFVDCIIHINGLYQLVISVRVPTCVLLFCFAVIQLGTFGTFGLHRAIDFL